jgi:HD-like signal output (HDOD) protein
MNDALLRKIDSLPPLPKTVIELEDFKRSGERDALKLLEIIEKDPLIVSTLLKVSNSAMFGFRSAVETPSRAVNLLGINFTISIALGSVIQNTLNTSPVAYGATADDFMRISNMSSNFLNQWIGKIDFDLKEELLLSVFLQETGKFIISDLIDEDGKAEEFLQKAKSAKDISTIEQEYLGTTTSKITASIFKHWQLSDKLIYDIEFVDDISNAPESSLEVARILNICKTLCNIIDPFSDTSVEITKAKAAEFGFDMKPLESAIEKMQDRLLDE